jgi:hypothetical protein
MPPGCSSTPFDEPFICDACGRGEDNCKCEECEECSEIGSIQGSDGKHHCLKHLDAKALEVERGRLEIVLFAIEAQQRDRYAHNPVICRRKCCGKPLTFEEARGQNGMPYHPECEIAEQKEAEDWK